MTDTPPPLPSVPVDENDDDALAAELALSLLEHEDERAAATRLAEDVEFRSLVQGWQERLAPLAVELTPVLAPARAKVRIDRALGDPTPMRVDPPARPRGGAVRWFGAALAAAAVVALAMIFLPQMWRGDAPSTTYIVTLSAEDGALEFSASMDSDDHMIEAQMTRGRVPDDRDYQLWWVAAEGAAPVSLGLIPRDGTMGRMPMPEGDAPAPGAHLAVTEEPLGGAPGNAVTGPVMAEAPLTSI